MKTFSKISIIGLSSLSFAQEQSYTVDVQMRENGITGIISTPPYTVEEGQRTSFQI